jgi:hypothetical protein
MGKEGNVQSIEMFEPTERNFSKNWNWITGGWGFLHKFHDWMSGLGKFRFGMRMQEELAVRRRTREGQG